MARPHGRHPDARLEQKRLPRVRLDGQGAPAFPATLDARDDAHLRFVSSQTARLWHPTRANCLTIFQHPDFVSSIAFHPKDDRFFLTGCCDFKLRVWSILEKKVRCAADLPEMVTAVAFSVDGKTCAAGTFSGRVHFFSDNLCVLALVALASRTELTRACTLSLAARRRRSLRCARPAARTPRARRSR